MYIRYGSYYYLDSFPSTRTLRTSSQGAQGGGWTAEDFDDFVTPQTDGSSEAGEEVDDDDDDDDDEEKEKEKEDEDVEDNDISVE